jgi:serine/threonine protein kinase
MLLTPPHSPHLTTSLAPEDRLGFVLEGRLKLVSILGIGAFGIVYQAVDVLTSIPFAVKALPKAGLDSRQRRIQQREIGLHHDASGHPNVVSLFRVIESPDCTYVVLEYCPEGDLFTQITERGAFIGDDFSAKRAFLQILDAVIHCHSLGIYHRDLKPENILVSDNGRSLKVGDFGLATSDYYSVDHGCGSTFYMSPGMSANLLAIAHADDKQNVDLIVRMADTRQHPMMSGVSEWSSSIFVPAAIHGNAHQPRTRLFALS